MNAPAGGVGEVVAEAGVDRLLEAITAYVQRQRWSGGRGAGLERVGFVDAVRLAGGEYTLLFTVIGATVKGEGEVRFALPLGLRPVGDPLAERAPAFMIGDADIEGHPMFLYDAAGDPAYIDWVWTAMRERRRVATAQGELSFTPLDETALAVDTRHVRWLGNEQSNTSMVVGDSAFLKHLRRVERGPSHELEMAQALSAAGFTHLAPLTGIGEYSSGGAAPSLVALAQPYLHNATEGWALALTSLRDLYADADEADLQGALQRHSVVDDQGSAFTAEAARLGTVVAAMHRCLASDALPPAAAPEALTRTRLMTWADTMTAELDQLLVRPDPALAPLRDARNGIVAHFAALRELRPGGLCTRIHGDLHLGQVLRTDAGWFVLDFEGEPTRSPAQRRERTSPLRDVAGMLRSFDYAAWVALAERSSETADDALERLGEVWASISRDAFWAAYLAAMEASGVLAEPGSSLVQRRAFEVQKAVYEVTYELGHRPSWARIPIEFLLRGAR